MTNTNMMPYVSVSGSTYVQLPRAVLEIASFIHARYPRISDTRYGRLGFIIHDGKIEKVEWTEMERRGYEFSFQPMHVIFGEKVYCEEEG